MPKLLVVAFKPEEIALSAGFAEAHGLDWDVLLLTGATSQGPSGGTVFAAALDSVPTADSIAHGVADLAGSYTHVAGVSTMASKDLLARVAGLWDAAMVTDAIASLSPTMFIRPVVAGSILATVEVLSSRCVVTFRPSGFKGGSLGSANVTPIGLSAETAEIISETKRSGGRPDLTQAKVVVSGGRPLGDAATFERVIGGLADKLGGAVGATRAAVDSGIAANELQVGQTGKIVAPNLYIAAGISGSTQHMAGIKDSKLIVAINKDPEAPIFEFADLGIVADLFDVVPELIAKL